MTIDDLAGTIPEISSESCSNYLYYIYDLINESAILAVNFIRSLSSDINVSVFVYLFVLENSALKIRKLKENI